MSKKIVMTLIILFGYLAMAFPSYAKEAQSKKGTGVEGIDPNLGNFSEWPEVEVPDGESKEDRMDFDLNCTKDIRYTEAQKKRLDQIYHRIYMDYISLIETYAWAGALTQDQKVLRYKMLKNYILTFQKRNYKWCSEHEEDEWEEEWYNNDLD